MNRLRAYPFLYLLLILIKPYSFCKYYNSTCYKLFFSSDSDTQSNTETISDVTITWDKISNNGTEACVEPGYENICSGHGNCSNSSCQCNRLEPLDNESESLFEYSGKFCEECPYCKGQRCKKFVPCLECILLNSSCEYDCYFHYNLVEKVEKYNYKDKICEVEDMNACLFNFKYFFDENNDVLLDIQKDKICLNGRTYLLICCYAFLVYIIFLMVSLKNC